MKSKVNRSHYESFTDPDGGHWIAMVAGKYEGTIWRPIEMKMDEEEEGKLHFTCEFLGDPVEDYMFERVAGWIINDHLAVMMENEEVPNPPEG